VTTKRNFFGRQRQSFEQNVDIQDLDLASYCSSSSSTFPGVFIRAPGIEDINDNDKVQVIFMFKLTVH